MTQNKDCGCMYGEIAGIEYCSLHKDAPEMHDEIAILRRDKAALKAHLAELLKVIDMVGAVIAKAREEP